MAIEITLKELIDSERALSLVGNLGWPRGNDGTGKPFSKTLYTLARLHTKAVRELELFRKVEAKAERAYTHEIERNVVDGKGEVVEKRKVLEYKSPTAQSDWNEARLALIDEAETVKFEPAEVLPFSIVEDAIEALSKEVAKTDCDAETKKQYQEFMKLRQGANLAALSWLFSFGEA